MATGTFCPEVKSFHSSEFLDISSNEPIYYLELENAGLNMINNKPITNLLPILSGSLLLVVAVLVVIVHRFAPMGLG